MERGQEPDALLLVPASVVPGDEHLVVDRVLAGGLAQQHHHLGPHQGHLGPKVVQAGRRLVRLRGPVLGRSALDDVADVYLRALKPDGVDHPRQQLAGAPHERTPLAVLLLARALADEHQPGVGVALSRHHVVSPLAEPALFTAPDLLQQLSPGHAHAPRLPCFFRMLKRKAPRGEAVFFSREASLVTSV